MIALREFCRIDLGRERVPDATTLLGFRHLLEEHELDAAMFSKVGELLLNNGLKLSGGTIVDSTIIEAPSSTKNHDNAHDIGIGSMPICESRPWNLGKAYKLR